MTVPQVLREVESRGLYLHAEGDRLRCGPSAELTDELRQALREHKPLLLRILGHNPLRREQLAVAEDGQLVAATRDDFLQRWGEEHGSLCWSYWMDWGPDLVEQGTLSLDEALLLRDRIVEGPEESYAEELIVQLSELEPKKEEIEAYERTR